jgi:dephospho-CoA kinase
VKLAITGMIASGKSTVLMELGRLGWLTVRTDELAWNAAYSDEGRELQKKYFGGEVPQKAEHRARFLSDESFREAWEAFIHPRVNAAWRGFMAQNLGANVAVEIPLLFEKKLEGEFEKVVVCSCPLEMALERWQSRGITGGEKEDYLALSKLLMPIDEKRRRADFHINNDSTREVLRTKVYEIHNQRVK